MPIKGMDFECRQCKRHALLFFSTSMITLFCVCAVFLPFLCAPQNSNEKRKPKRVKWVYDHLGRLWMSFRCRSDVVSDVVQIAGGIQKIDILLCDRSKHSDTSGRTGLWKLKMAHVGWKWKTKQNRMWFSQTPIYVYVWFGCRFRCRSRCRSPPKWTTLKTV